MNREDIIRMAREAGLFVPQAGIPENGALTRFAALVAAAERERIKAANEPVIEHINRHLSEMTAAITAPPQRKPLTEEEIVNIGKAARAVEGPHILPVSFARAIERAHGIGEQP